MNIEIVKGPMFDKNKEHCCKLIAQFIKKKIKEQEQNESEQKAI